MTDNGEKNADGQGPPPDEKIKITRKRKRLYAPSRDNENFDEEAPPARENKTLRVGGKSMEARAVGLVKDHVIFSMAVGTLPIPLLDMAAVAGVQLRLLDRLTRLYGMSFSGNAGKSAIASIVGGIGSCSLGGAFASLAKAIPVAGPVFGAAMMPVAAGAATYALGKVFIMHFESGGTFLDFSPESVRQYYAEQFDEGKEIVSAIKSNGEG